MTQQTDDSERDPAQAKKNAQANFDRMLTGIPMEIQDREASLASRLAALPGSPIKKLRALHKEMEILSAAMAPYVACSAGCSACCHYPVHLYPVEAELIEKRSSHSRLPKSLPSADFHGSPCPFLIQEQCSIYEDRPMVCRQHVALTNTAYWCDPVRSGEITLPMAQLSKVQEAFHELVAKDGRTTPMDIRQIFAVPGESS